MRVYWVMLNLEEQLVEVKGKSYLKPREMCPLKPRHSPHPGATGVCEGRMEREGGAGRGER